MKLAVVIPAYKEAFFAQALESLASQTDSRFTVYIGDDCSPADLRSVALRFNQRLQIRYHRFGNNIGAERLVDQWRRCVELIDDEEWIWIFSDDDLASPNCVETFFRRAPMTGGDVYRFNTTTIDAQNREIAKMVASPNHERSESMALNLLRGLRGNSMPDHIFSRRVYAKKGGFVYTPYAQAADWATSILFSQDKGMHMLQEGTVHWRKAGNSISSNVSRNRTKTILGHYVFIDWLLRHFEYLKNSSLEMDVSFADIQRAALQNLGDVITFHYRGLPPALYAKHIRFIREHFQMNFAQASSHLLHLIIRRLRHDRYERLAAAHCSIP